MTSYVWGQRATPFGPSDYQRVVRDQLEEWGEQVDALAREADGQGTQPQRRRRPVAPVAGARPGRGGAPPARRGRARPRRRPRPQPDQDLDLVESARVAEWDDDLAQLLAEARAERATSVAVPAPRRACPRPAVARLRDDPEAFARELARPMPRPPSHRPHGSAPPSTRGSRTRFGQQALIEPDELPGRADAGIDDEADLRRGGQAASRTARSPTARRTPSRRRSRWCWPVRWSAAGSTRSTREPDGGYLVVDWKTSRHETADPLQLALYRLAWAELTDTPPGPGAGGLPLRPLRPDRRARRPAGPRRSSRRCVDRLSRRQATQGSRERDLDHLAEGLLALLRGGLLAGDDVVARRCRWPAPCGRTPRRACRARWPPSRRRARRTRPSAPSSSGRGA